MSEQNYADLSATQFVLGADERALWSGRCAVAEYAFDEPASLPRWTLPEETEVVVTDQRVLYRGPGAADTGELRWLWPQHLRVQPGSRDTGRQATVTQIQLVCAGPAGSFPALVFAGGDLTAVREADRVANTLRQAIARYRVEHAGELGIAAPQVRMLSRLVIGPEFNNYQGGEGQTVSLIGSVSVETHAAPTHAPAPGYVVRPEHSTTPDHLAVPEYGSAPGSVAAPGYAEVAPIVAPSSPAAPVPVVSPEGGFGRSGERTTRIQVSPQREPWSARPAETTDLHGHPDLDTRAAELAARVANLVAGGDAQLGGQQRAEVDNRTNLSAYLDVPPASSRPRGANDGGDDISGRAESVRRTAARFAGNAARGRGSAPRYDDEVGSSGRGSHRQG